MIKKLGKLSSVSKFGFEATYISKNKFPAQISDETIGKRQNWSLTSFIILKLIIKHEQLQ